MARWFRFYEDALNDPKVQLLEPKLFKAWVNLLCLASQHDGLIPCITDVSFALRTSETEAGRIVDGLISAGLIDEIEEHLEPHNWHSRQFKSDGSTERVKRFRQRFRNVSSAVSETGPETGPDTDTDTDTDTEKKETRASGALSCASAFDDFWKAWPNKVGKPAALKAFKAAIDHGTDTREIQRGIVNYVRDKPPDRPWLNPATFLNQNRWEDRPAPVAAKPLTEFQRQQAETRDVLAKLDEYIDSNSDGETSGGILSENSGQRSGDLHRGAGAVVFSLSGNDRKRGD